MFDLIAGLPLHPLVVHAVVVLLPLIALGGIAVAVIPRWRPRFSGLLALAAAGLVVIIPVATQSGEALAERVGEPEHHAELGDAIIWFALPLAVLLVLTWWYARQSGRTESGPDAQVSSRQGTTNIVSRIILPVLTVVIAIACLVQVYLVGESGARAVWEDQVSSTSTVQD